MRAPLASFLSLLVAHIFLVPTRVRMRVRRAIRDDMPAWQGPQTQATELILQEVLCNEKWRLKFVSVLRKGNHLHEIRRRCTSACRAPRTLARRGWWWP
jgi:hypothetical protein